MEVIRMICCAGLLSLGAGVAMGEDAVDFTVKELVANSKNPEYIALIMGAGLGAEGATALAEHDHKGKVYCPPENFAVTGNNYAQILKSFLDKRPDLANNGALSVGWIMALALKQTFPCKD